MKIIFLLVFLTVSFSDLFSQELSLFEKKYYANGTDTLGYRILYPANYDRARSYPLIVFLHGAGHRGKDNQKQLVNGASLFFEGENQERISCNCHFSAVLSQ